MYKYVAIAISARTYLVGVLDIHSASAAAATVFLMNTGAACLPLRRPALIGKRFIGDGARCVSFVSVLDHFYYSCIDVYWGAIPIIKVAWRADS